MSSPAAFNDNEMNAILDYAAPLAICDRGAFLCDVTAALKNVAERGPGLVARTCGEVQRKYLRNLECAVGPERKLPPKYSRRSYFIDDYGWITTPSKGARASKKGKKRSSAEPRASCGSNWANEKEDIERQAPHR